jgi:DeoR family glycerol-3-phosphate regulon repressor
MKIKKRQTKLIELVRRQEKVSVEALAAQLDASRETIRRDLSQLAQSGKILKVHGGAMMPRVMVEGPFKQRLSDFVDAKVEIAKAAAGLFVPGETLFLDTGSTTLMFAEAIASMPGLTIVTNSTEIARVIAAAKTGSRAFLLGGEFNADNSQSVGTMAVTQIRAFRAHHAVLTVGALDARSGAMDYNIEEAQIARAMIEQSNSVTVLADSSKFSALASFAVCPLSQISRLVTEAAPPEDTRAAFADAGGELIVAQGPRP